MISRLTPLWTVHAAGLAGTALAIGVFWQWTWRPLQVAAATHQERCDHLQQLMSGRGDAAVKNTAWRAQVAELQQRVDATAARLPADEEGAAFLRQWQRIAESNELKLLDLRREAVEHGQELSRFQVKCRCQGGFASISRALDQVYQLPRLVNVVQFDATGGHKTPDYPFSITFELYFREPHNDT
ncbi:MAG: type 4a pilus biogenesis protein PilO, partial [Planctomycetales bacterium]|nr:type 4a pilus biogenesis protein PilO [Planctomycetales bacterium]